MYPRVTLQDDTHATVLNFLQFIDASVTHIVVPHIVQQ